MPLAFADIGVKYVIQRLSGKPETKKHLENLGFVVGSSVTVISMVNGSMIVKIKECRVAINQELAQKIFI